MIALSSLISDRLLCAQQVGDVMARDVICLAKMAKPSDVEALISKCDRGDCSHHAFPVVDSG